MHQSSKPEKNSQKRSSGKLENWRQINKRRKKLKEQEKISMAGSTATQESDAKAEEHLGRAWTLSVAVPGAVLENAQSPELRAHLVGQVARAAAVFCVDELIVYDETASMTQNDLHALTWEAVELVLQKKKEEIERLTENLSHIDRHEALYLLRNCFAIPKLTYVFRTSPCYVDTDGLKDIDDMIMHSVESLLNCSLRQSALSRASLPISLGGLGVRKPSEIALPAFIASNHESSSLCDQIVTKVQNCRSDQLLINALSVWDSKGVGRPEPGEYHVQKNWDTCQLQTVYNDVLKGADSDAERASIIAASDPNSGAWIRALPSLNLGLKLQNDHLRIAAGLRIGAKLTEVHKCICGSDVDSLGVHALACGKVAGRYICHTELNNIIGRALKSAQIPVVLEPQGLARDDGKRPDGMTLVPWDKGISVIWDVTCVSTTAQSNMKTGLEGAGKIAMASEGKKEAKYSDLGSSYTFIPLGFETSGAFGPSASAFIGTVGHKLQAITGEPRAVEYLKQRLSVAIQRGNAMCVTSTYAVTLVTI